MRKTALMVCFVVLPMLAGCTISDALFEIFGDHYTGGGTTRDEKYRHYDQQVEASQDYGSWNP